MDFSDALKLIKSGKWMCRSKDDVWTDYHMYVSLHPNYLGEHCTHPYFYQRTNYKNKEIHITPWLPSLADLLADDWEEYTGTYVGR